MTAQPWLEELTHDECVQLLRAESVGRIGFVFAGFPIVLPVNYRLVETTGRTWLALRTRPGNVLEQADTPVAFEIDAVNRHAKQGWSVLARGTLHHVDPEAADFRQRFDPEPWMTVDRDAWLAIDPFEISGRRLHPAEHDWAFAPSAYL
jgi:nitroimidazol reductase NimA-like FMN-containing flavoprotein (pyridoxamine 5'-phosphate oxidase superfamily)